MRSQLTAAATSLTLLLTLTGCFTGVESTPRITADSASERPVSAGDTLLSRVRPEPPAQWQPGKRFFITDNRFSLLLGASAPDAPLQGSVITYEGMEQATSPTGAAITRISFSRPESSELMVYTTPESPDKLRQRQALEIPFAIEESMVAEAGRVLTGRRLYVLSRMWRDGADRLLGKGRKYVEVMVDTVLPGTTAAQIQVCFTDPATSTSASLFLNPDSKARTPRTFNNLFSLTDPRLRYPDILPKHWELITEGRIAEGMTRRECRLAIGAPANVTQRVNYGTTQERWVYEDGVWLIFEDDLLTDYRK